jgi:hypothetical protein
MRAFATLRSLSAVIAALLALTAPGQSQQQKPDAATSAWWAQTVALSNDAMEGRDTGTEAYERAAKYVADQFAAAGLKPAGENGTFFQRVPMHQVDLDLANSTVVVSGPNPPGGLVAGSIFSSPIRLLYETTLTPRESLPPKLSGELVFTGYGAVDASIDLHGKIAVFYNNAPASLPAAERERFAARRIRELTQAGAIALVSIDNLAATEPTHWPSAYARTVTIKSDRPTTAPASQPVVLRISAEAAPKLFTAVNAPYQLSPPHPFAELLRHAEAGDPIASFPLFASLEIKLATTSKEISSPNIIGILPGSDPKLAYEYVALSAHLDGYGYGTPVLGDKLYNGTLDDAAYVALLIQVAKDLQHKAPARSLLFSIFTGEEKGLLGSAYYTQHLTVPKESIVADLNLDQLRPIFPLNILTMEGLNDSTLGETVRTVAQPFKIEIRPDLEPERNLFRRSDNYNFVRIGVPIASFVFGYDKGSPEEVIYRDWYARRYHKPQDDIKTPIDWNAAGRFNRFYTALAISIANASTSPQWLPSSLYSPHQTNPH